jgi:hypothetical protein
MTATNRVVSMSTLCNTLVVDESSDGAARSTL